VVTYPARRVGILAVAKTQFPVKANFMGKGIYAQK